MGGRALRDAGADVVMSGESRRARRRYVAKVSVDGRVGRLAGDWVLIGLGRGRNGCRAGAQAAWGSGW